MCNVIKHGITYGHSKRLEHVVELYFASNFSPIVWMYVWV